MPPDDSYKCAISRFGDPRFACLTATVILGIQGNRVRLGLIAPSQVLVLREEVQARADWATAEGLAEVAVCTADTAGVLQ